MTRAALLSSADRMSPVIWLETVLVKLASPPRPRLMTPLTVITPPAPGARLVSCQVNAGPPSCASGPVQLAVGWVSVTGTRSTMVPEAGVNPELV